MTNARAALSAATNRFGATSVSFIEFDESITRITVAGVTCRLSRNWAIAVPRDAIAPTSRTKANHLCLRRDRLEEPNPSGLFARTACERFPEPRGAWVRSRPPSSQ